MRRYRHELAFDVEGLLRSCDRDVSDCFGDSVTRNRLGRRNRYRSCDSAVVVLMSRKNPRDRRVKMLRLWLRGLRKMSRRIEDAKKKERRDTMRRRFFAWLDGKEIEE